ncbi:hypothetical protein Sjap_022232 [Stephania japonica]|uniref:Uncharacterized protein n=1 Tax=Stephania japonica TaxID=461633 RepID=A0AAP0HUV3_9MAGN
MAALKLVMMGVVFVALLGASPSTVEARTHIPSILATSKSLENIARYQPASSLSDAARLFRRASESVTAHASPSVICPLSPSSVGLFLN